VNFRGTTTSFIHLRGESSSEQETHPCFQVSSCIEPKKLNLKVSIGKQQAYYILRLSSEKTINK
jgi:hypothetical protein